MLLVEGAAKRRRFQFSLRLLIILALLFGVLLTANYFHERAIVGEITEIRQKAARTKARANAMRETMLRTFRFASALIGPEDYEDLKQRRKEVEVLDKEWQKLRSEALSIERNAFLIFLSANEPSIPDEELIGK